MAWVKILAASVAAAGLAVPASAAGYLKIPDIDGESKGESDEQPAYITITMERDTPSSSAGDSGHKDWIPIEGVSWTPRRDSRDAASGMATGKRQHKAVTTTKEIDKASPTRMRASTATQSAAAGGGGGGKVNVRDLTMKKYTDNATYLPPRDYTGPGSVTLPARMPGCRVGKRYPHAFVGDEGGKQVKLVDVTVAQCASEVVTITYETIQRLN